MGVMRRTLMCLVPTHFLMNFQRSWGKLDTPIERLRGSFATLQGHSGKMMGPLSTCIGPFSTLWWPYSALLGTLGTTGTDAKMGIEFL